MFRRAFTEDLPITWYLYEEPTGRCRVQDYLDQCTSADRNKLIARMEGFARSGNWRARVGFIKQLDLPPKLASKATLYEVKSHQDRILFIRDGNDAIAIDAMKKKNDWSKKDNNALKAAVAVAKAAQAERKGGR